jgi:hypothetical protein
MNYRGGCHCGNLRINFATDIDPAEIEIRACQCAFCRKHNSRAVADACGRLSIVVNDSVQLSRYVFGLQTAEYLICRICGVYVAAVTRGDHDRRAIVIVNCLDQHDRFTRPPAGVDYDSECKSDRVERRKLRWMPVTLAFLN